MSGCGISLCCSRATANARRACHPILDRLTAERYLLTTRRVLECGCYGVTSSSNRRIQVLKQTVGWDPSCVIEIVRGGRSGLGDHKGPCSGGGPI